MSLELISGLMMGASFGLFSGLILAKHVGLQPNAKVLQQALDTSKEYYKEMNQKWKGRIKEYEQPSELQKFANVNQGASPGDIVGLLANELPNIKGLPRWVRPLIPGIQAYLKENPEQVQALITKFANVKGAGEPEKEGAYL